MTPKIKEACAFPLISHGILSLVIFIGLYGLLIQIGSNGVTSVKVFGPAIFCSFCL